MKKFLQFIVSWLSVLILAVLTANVGRLIYGIFFPRELGEGFFELFTPGIIEGFVFMYLFFLPVIFVSVFKEKWWKYALVPALIVFLPFSLFWQIALFGILFFVVGVLLGLLAVWLKKKL